MLTGVRQRKPDLSRNDQADYQLEPDGRYRIARYDAGPPFSSFLPGIAGPDGVPLWCLYVNRAQAVVSFGVQDKNHAIAEYLPATWAYQLVGAQGFRTFCKIDGAYYEPFRETPPEHPDCVRTMLIGLDSLEITEENPARGLVFRVLYFSPVNRPIGSLIRRLTITNTASTARRLDLLDGLALVVPAGLTDHGLKAMRHIQEAYSSVRLTHDHVPFFAAKVAAHDEAEVVGVAGGNFYAAWLAGRRRWQPLRPFVDPHVVFGAGHDLVSPRRFIAAEALDPAEQVWENRLPCALAPAEAVLGPGESLELVALVGYASNEQLLEKLLSRFQQLRDVDHAREESRELIESVTAPARCASGQPVLDAYLRQNYLDNVLRGGIPVLLPSTAGPTPLHLYARRHGDLERDYNHFVLPSHPLSSGAGNYRDVCQNRRWDVWFYPQVGEQEIRQFVSLLQADGYNPLSVEGYRWRIAPGVDPLSVCPTSAEAPRAAFCRIVQHWFDPGELLQWANGHGLHLDQGSRWLVEVLKHSERRLFARGHDGGYWVDHWTYVTDLLESYAAVFPDAVEPMLVGAADVGWFDEGAYVTPRQSKYAWRSTGPLQIHAVVGGQPAPHPLPPVTVFGKLCALAAVKVVTFDYECRGIEMEAGRPGWNDSLNGLPGLFGSSVGEAAELARLAIWLRRHLARLPDTAFPVEVADFLEEVVGDLSAGEYSWDRAAGIRERFRARLRQGASGRTRTLSGDQLASLLAGVERRACGAVERSVDPQTGLLHTYYRNRPVVLSEHEGTEHAPADLAGAIRQFRPEPLPLYLEGQVHWLRLPGGRQRAAAIYRAVRESPLFDAALQMYKLNECLDRCGPQIGRARTFTRGWFENESIWLHMSYKYLLELLRCGLHEEFFRDAATMLVPFMDPRVYGRSILENSSFLASSANPDRATHGRGFIARLSGSTAEFIHLWLLLTVGQNPFRLDGGELRLQLSPVLPGGWFNPQPVRIEHDGQPVDIPANSLACTMLGTVLLVYHNESRRDTFGPHAVRPVRYVLDDGDRFDGPALGAEAAHRVRRRQCRRLDVWLE